MTAGKVDQPTRRCTARNYKADPEEYCGKRLPLTEFREYNDARYRNPSYSSMCMSCVREKKRLHEEGKCRERQAVAARKACGWVDPVVKQFLMGGAKHA